MFCRDASRLSNDSIRGVRQEGSSVKGKLQPLAWSPPRVYVLRDLWSDPATARRVERVCESCPDAEVRTYTYADVPEIVAEEGWGCRPKMGTMAQVPPPIPFLGRFRFDREAVDRDAKAMQDAYKGPGSFPWRRAAGGIPFKFFCSHMKDVRIDPQHVCRPQWRIHQGVGCPHQCSYCSLGKFIIADINTEEYIEHLARLLDQNPWQKTWLYDDGMDVLTFEPQLDTLGPLMRFFESTGDRYLIVHTKSDRVEPVIEAGAPRNTIIVWSLSGPTQSRLLEKVAGTTEQRIDAARRCAEAGIQIRYKFKPIVPVKTWREDAEFTVRTALTQTRPDNLSMTVLMWMQVEDLKACIPNDLLDPEFLAQAEAAAESMRGSPNAPYPEPVRETIYRKYFEEVRRLDPDIPLTISTESLTMWQRMGKVLGVTPATYVCGCGAGSTPGRRLLATNPWDDAAGALTWDGRPAVAGGE